MGNEAFGELCHNFMEKLLTKRKRYAAMVATSERRVGFASIWWAEKGEKYVRNESWRFESCSDKS